MATFCTKCGASLTSTLGFCPSCGTPIGSPAATPREVFANAPVQMPPPPAVYGQVGAYPVAPPQKSGGALKVVLIVIAVVVGLGVLGFGILGYIGYRTLHAAGNSFSVGSAAQVTDSDLGVAVYPGATAKEGGAARVKIGNSTIVSAKYTTSDPVSSVVAFYQGKVGGQAIVNKSVNGTSFESATSNGGEKDSLVVTVGSAPANSSVTQIVILHTKATSATPPATQ
jgi:hypothetical protein